MFLLTEVSPCCNNERHNILQYFTQTWKLPTEYIRLSGQSKASDVCFILFGHTQHQNLQEIKGTIITSLDECDVLSQSATFSRFICQHLQNVRPTISDKFFKTLKFQREKRERMDVEAIKLCKYVHTKDIQLEIATV